MALRYQILRGTTAKRTAYTPLPGELVLDTDTKKVYVGDGTTAGGVPVSPNVINDLTTGGTDAALSAEQGKVLKNMIDGLASGLVYKGTFDASTGSFPSDIKVGDFYKVSVAGTVGGLELAVGDMIIANKTKSGSTSASDFDKIDNTEAPDILRTSHINTSITLAGASDSNIPSTLAIKTYVDNIASTKINLSTVTTNGDLIVGTGSGTVTRLAMGTADQVLKVKSDGTGLEYSSVLDGGILS